jgi:hypothetical protein
MTIKEIYDRYRVPEEAQERMLAHAGWLVALHDSWVGPSIDWNPLLKAALLSECGQTPEGKAVTKVVGIDKYTKTMMDWCKKENAQLIILGNNWHYKIYYYLQTLNEKGDATLNAELSANTVDDVGTFEKDVESSLRARLLRFDIKHYKNPSH